MEAIGGTLTDLPDSTVVDIIPPAGETWAITYMAANSDTARPGIAIGESATSTGPMAREDMAGFVLRAPNRAIVIDQTKYLSIFTQSGTSHVDAITYSGVKL